MPRALPLLMRGDGRPRRLLGVGQARELHAHATALLGVVVVGHHADHEAEAGPVALLGRADQLGQRAGASGRRSGSASGSRVEPR